MHDIHWQISLIRRLRPDLCELFPVKDTIEWCVFVNWLATWGVKEYRVLAENTLLVELGEKLNKLQSLIYSMRPDLQEMFPFPDKHQEFQTWFFRHPLPELGLWSLFSPSEKVLLKAPEASPAFVSPQARQLPFGVNLIGYAFGQLGIGEDLRMAARALQAANVPLSIFNFPPGSDIPQGDSSMQQHVAQELPYGINVFCMTALEQGRFYVEHGRACFDGYYNIGYWPWELAQWPEEWVDLSCLVDEVWVSTQHICKALVPVANVPVVVMPMAVELGEISVKSRQDFQLPAQAHLFCFAFDLNSSMQRKNPQACIKAFQQAFPVSQFDQETVGLVIKVHPPRQPNPAWDALKVLAASDPRLHIIEQTLSRADLLALYQACDCFLSLHRAEGFGRGIAEAMQLGLHVITTGYSGNVDFCRDKEAVDLVDYCLVEVGEQYPYGVGQLWAEPDVTHAASLMRQFVQSARRVEPREYPEFAALSVGERYREQLRHIGL